jgi:hypothetical protein
MHGYSSGSDAEECENTTDAHWQYSEEDWVSDNNYALLLAYEDMQQLIRSLGANVLTNCSFADFCHIVLQFSWIPELGKHVPRSHVGDHLLSKQ